MKGGRMDVAGGQSARMENGRLLLSGLRVSIFQGEYVSGGGWGESLGCASHRETDYLENVWNGRLSIIYIFLEMKLSWATIENLA